MGIEICLLCLIFAISEETVCVRGDMSKEINCCWGGGKQNGPGKWRKSKFKTWKQRCSEQDMVLLPSFPWMDQEACDLEIP